MFPIPLVLLIVSGFSGTAVPWTIAACVTALVGVGVLMLICRWRGIPHSWSWTVAALVFGPAVAITLSATHRRVPVAKLAPPTLTGCEVFG